MVWDGLNGSNPPPITVWLLIWDNNRRTKGKQTLLKHVYLEMLKTEGVTSTQIGEYNTMMSRTTSGHKMTVIMNIPTSSLV